MSNYINLSAIRSLRGFRNGEPGYDVTLIGTPVSGAELQLNGGEYFELRGFDDSGVEYFVGNGTPHGKGIWSIGQHKETKRIIASTGSDLYGDERYDCLWLR